MSNGADKPAPEVPVRMPTKGEGWSGRESADGGTLSQTVAPDKKPGSRPAPPNMGPGAPKPEYERFGDVEVPEEYQAYEDPFTDIPDDHQIDGAKAFEDTRIFEVLDDMDREFVALHAVKSRIREIAALLLIDRLRRTLNIESDPPTLHMSFTGNPGVGKTSVAMKMGQILYKLGYVRKGHLVVASRDDLVGQYVGHTAPKTREVLKRAMGGVLFIDEAYNIYRLDNERDYGQETVEMLLQVMENQRQDLVVIFAGYKDKLERFYNDVPGISSRIAHHIDFPDYDLGELIDIGKLMVGKQRYRFSPDAEKAFSDYMKLRMEQARFANARSVRNALERARMRQAIRLFDSAQSGNKLTKGDLITIEADDLLKSRVFTQEGEYFQYD